MHVTEGIVFRIKFLRAMLSVMTETDINAFGRICTRASANELEKADIEQLEELYQKFEKKG